MASLLFIIGFAFTITGIVFLVGFTARLYYVPFDYFGMSHYFLIGVGLFLMALARIMHQKPGEGFWRMKHDYVP